MREHKESQRKKFLFCILIIIILPSLSFNNNWGRFFFFLFFLFFGLLSLFIVCALLLRIPFRGLSTKVASLFLMMRNNNKKKVVCVCVCSLLCAMHYREWVCWYLMLERRWLDLWDSRVFILQFLAIRITTSTIRSFTCCCLRYSRASSAITLRWSLTKFLSPFNFTLFHSTWFNFFSSCRRRRCRRILSEKERKWPALSKKKEQ